jgi:CspA family cold shock protein
VRGIIKYFNTDKGYGFLKTPEHPTDVFVHIKDAQKARIGELHEGDTLTFDIVPAKDGKFAAANLQRT